MKVYGTDTHARQDLREMLSECEGGLSVHRNGLSHKTRFFHMFPGLGSEHNLGVYNNTVNAVERAFLERYFLCKYPSGFAAPVRPQPQRFKSLSSFRKELLMHMPKLPVLTLADTVNLFPAHKRKVYEKAHEDLSRHGFSRKDARLKSFVKFEKQDVSKAPRIINPRSAKYNLTLGRYLKHAEHKYYKAINKAFGNHTPATVFKGMDADASATVLRRKWDRFSRPVAIGIDATKFDMHVSRQALEFEHSVYLGSRFMCPDKKELKELLSMQLDNRGTARCDDGVVQFHMSGTRCSGDVNTSLGNCILMCALVWQWSIVNNVDLELANNGDDCVIILEECDLKVFLDSIESHMLSYGFHVVVEKPVFEFEEIEFCQTQCVKLNSGWRSVRNFRTVFKKDTMCLRSIPNIDTLRKWMYSVGVGGLSACSGVPILESFYQLYERSGVRCDWKAQNPYRFANTSALKNDSISSETRASFYIAFGVTPIEQRMIESYLRHSTITWAVVGPVHRDDIVNFSAGHQLTNYEQKE